MNRTTLRAAAAATLAALAVAGCSATPAATPSASTGADAGKPSGRVTVFAAASLNKAFEEIGKAVAQENPGLEVVYSFDGSNSLVDQLAGGARADVLATADEKTMNRAVEEKLVAGTPAMFATNVLTIVTPTGNPKGVTGLNQSLDGTRLVVCAPAVPCGQATQRLAQRLGVTLKPVSEESKVTDVLGKVTSGEADAGMVYTTDAATAKDKVTVVPIDGADADPNRYPVAETVKPENPAGADAFVAHLTSEKGRAVLARYGFGAP